MVTGWTLIYQEMSYNYVYSLGGIWTYFIYLLLLLEAFLLAIFESESELSVLCVCKSGGVLPNPNPLWEWAYTSYKLNKTSVAL